MSDDDETMEQWKARIFCAHDEEGCWMEVEFYGVDPVHDRPVVDVFVGHDDDPETCELKLVQARELHNLLGRWLAFHEENMNPPPETMSDETNWHAEALKQRARADKAEARVAELEERVSVLSRGEAYTYVQTLEDRSARLQARVAGLEESVCHCGSPPEGHVAVLLPREVVETWIRIGDCATRVQVATRDACRKALEG